MAKSYVWGSPAERRRSAAAAREEPALDPESLLASLRVQGRAGVPGLAEDLGVSKQAVRKVGDGLAEQGRLRVVPGTRGKGGRPREYVYVEPTADERRAGLPEDPLADPAGAYDNAGREETR